MKNFSKIIFGFVALIIGIFVYFNFQNKPKPQKTVKKHSEDPQLNYAIQMDQKNLLNPDTTIDEKAKSIKRLATQRDPKVTEYALKFWESGQIKLQAAAVEAIGIFPHEGSRSIIKSALYSGDSSLTESALIALSRQGGKENERELILFLEKNQNKDLAFLANRSLLIVAATEEGKSYALNQILSIANDLSNKKSSEALLVLYKYAPNTPILVKKAKLAWKNYKDPLVWTRSLQFLDAKDSVWVQENLTELPLDGSGKYTQVLIDTLNKHCPSEAEAYFKKIEGSSGYERLNPKPKFECL